MDLVHSGFDNLDITFFGKISPQQAELFQTHQDHAKVWRSPSKCRIGDVCFNIAQTGRRGGYAFRADTGPFGEIWSFKRPNENDPWGIHVSCSSFACATLGLRGVRKKLDDTLVALGVNVPAGMQSISRIDFCMDFLAPDFVPDPAHFVMHPRFSQRTTEDPQPKTYLGRSGRVETVMIGKNPGRQVIVYDKRTEVLKFGKAQWPEIWNRNRKASGLPLLDMSNPSSSQVWRLELRAYKKHLKEYWKVASWWELQQKLPDILFGLLDDIRYTTPSGDSHRSRWPNHPMWDDAHKVLTRDLLSMLTFASEERIIETQRTDLIRKLTAQIAGCTITLAAMRREKDVGVFAEKFSKELAELYRAQAERTQQKFDQAREIYP
ncbi:hypothetical protein [Hyphomonas oceanitis]|uniref:hypothetical protein n=1 Tax=Hyphomonas oceanitis TaxID=81033 RepID=UPI003002C630